ncbi:MAG: hypothetical protein DRO05_00255 [Thermoproteota archaeon]|nr:MAG: hypothetical protein DRO05_00255 [Candidatus Korarchaeota archaeon]
MTIEILSELDSLAMAVLEIEEDIKDYMQVAAILESLGITREIARSYGFEDVFSLSKAVMELIDYYKSRQETVSEEKRSLTEKLKEGVVLFLLGLLSGSPWLLSTISFSLTGVSLYSIVNADIKVATVIGLALIASLLATSGIQSVFMRKVLFYTYQLAYGVALRFLTLYYLIGTSTVIFSGILFYLLLSPVFPPNLTSLGLIYFLALSMLWLATAPLYALKKYTVLFLVFVMALFVVNVALYESSLDFVRAHIYGIFFGILASMIYLFVYIYVRFTLIRAVSEETVVRLPSLSLTLLLGTPYFIASVLYFLLIVADQLVVWTRVGSPLLMDLNYETGKNLALLILPPLFGLVHYFLIKLYKLIEEGGRSRIRDRIEYCRTVVSFYKRAIFSVIIAGTLILLLIYFLSLKGKVVWKVSEESLLVLRAAGIGNILLAVVLINSLISFYLYRPKLMLYSLLLGLILNLALSFLISQRYGIYYASLSYLLGCLASGVVSSLQIIRSLRRIDYYYYTAF